MGNSTQPLALHPAEHTFAHTHMHAHTETHTHPGLDSRAEEAGDRERRLFSYPPSPPFTTSKHFSESVKACLIAALAARAVFKNRRGEQRGSHFKNHLASLTRDRPRNGTRGGGRGREPGFGGSKEGGGGEQGEMM